MRAVKTAIMRYCLVSIGAFTALWLAADGKHHWHEVRFLYATTHFSIQDILAGAFNPEQAGQRLDEIGSGGFYFSKVLHLWLLQSLFRQIEAADGGFAVAVGISILLVACSVAIAYGIFRRLFNDQEIATAGTFCLVLMPMIPYLAGKLLSEVTALFFVSISIWTFLRASESRDGSCFLLTVVSGLFLLLAGLARIDSVLNFVGLGVALLIVADTKQERRHILKAGVYSVGIFALVYVAVMSLIGIKAEALSHYFMAVVTSEMKSVVMSLFGCATFGGVMYVFALKGLFSRQTKYVSLLTVWLLVSGCSAILLTYRYMIEPRYLVNAIFPLAGLAGVGMDAMLRRWNTTVMSGLLMAALLVPIILINLLAVRLMPYELDGPSIIAAVDKITENNKKARILIPWAYTDFHFLRTMKPELRLYNVNTLDGNSNLTQVNQWQERFRRWYGESYLIDPAKLDTLLMDGPIYYLGWGRYPPIAVFSKFIEYIGITKLSAFLARLPLRDHLAASWVWNNVRYRMTLLGTIGQYEFYKVELSTDGGV